jgi:hypothetical protein
MIAVSVILLVVVLVIVSATTKAQQPYTQVIMNLLNGQQYFGTPHVYQGDNVGTPTSQWPVYYGPSTASQYWSQGGISSDQPVLELAPAQQGVAGAMFWSETYSGGVIKITIIGTFSSSWPPTRKFGDGFEIYLFLNPTMWSISPNYNYSIPYKSIVGIVWAPSFVSSAIAELTPLVPLGGDVVLPQSSTPYIVVQWDPWWQFGGSPPGATGQWNVWIVSNPSGNNPSVGPSPSPNLGSSCEGWDSYGTGAFEPHPGDLIKITVTYDPSTNTLSGVATDLNTGQSASFTLNLNGYYTPPRRGTYVFGIAGNTGDWYADWALLYVATTQQPTTPAPTPPPPSPLYVRVIAPSYASWTIYANASTGWYAYYSGTGSGQFGPAFPGWPGTSVSLNVSSISDCPSPSVTYEPSNEVTLSNGANYVTVLISCEPMVGVGLNMSYGGGLIMLINKPGLPMTSLMLNGPVNNNLTLPINTTITLIIWPYNGYTLAGLSVNGEPTNYIGTPWGSYIATITITNQTTITITYKQQ